MLFCFFLRFTIVFGFTLVEFAVFLIENPDSTHRIA